MSSRFRTTLAVLLATVFFSPAAASAAACTWQVFTPPNPDPNNSALVDVAVAAPNDVWALGAGARAFLHFDGANWSIVPSSIPPSSLGGIAIFAIGATGVGANNSAWVVGQNGFNPFTGRWDGTTWQVVPSPKIDGQLLTVLPLDRARGVWAAGDMNTSRAAFPLLEHFSNVTGAWKIDQRVYMPGSSNLDTLAGVVGGDLWAGGSIASGNPEWTALMVHQNPATRTWVEVLGQPAPGFIASMSAATLKDVWAVGPGSGVPNIPPYIERWNGTVWSQVSYPRTGAIWLTRVDADRFGGVWLMGQYFLAGPSFIDRFDGQRWREVKPPLVGRGSSYAALRTVPGKKDAWLVGSYGTASGTTANLAVRWTCP
jgi:hypothetical protein